MTTKGEQLAYINGKIEVLEVFLKQLEEGKVLSVSFLNDTIKKLKVLKNKLEKE
jgi:hypothetical protein